MNLFGLTAFFILFFVAFSEDRVPAVPLVVKSPYLSIWLANQSKHLFGDWATFWTGAVKGFSGLIKVDGKAYEFMGHPTADNIGTKLQVVQKGLKITPTQSIFTLDAGPVELTVNFFTPVDPTDLKLLSLPGSYIAFNVRSTDKVKHKVEVYVDITGEWAGGNPNQTVTWSHNNKVANGLSNFDIHLQNQKEFSEFHDQAEWGTIKFFADSNATFQTGEGIHVRSEFVKNSKLNDEVDKNFRPINKNWPVFAYSHDLGMIDDSHHGFYLGIAQVRHPSISHATGTVNGLWESYFNGSSNEMIAFLYNDRIHALERANALDSKIMTEAHEIGGDSYVKIVSAALRQAFGGTELVGTPAKPWMMVKEISSDGNCQTADVIYPHFPVLYYLNPHLIKLQLDPLFENQESGLYPHKYAMHDLGAHYPRCIGHKDGRDEPMEVEESANMIVMAAAYSKATKDVDYVKKHYKILKQWAVYCVDHGLYTGNALTTDDFLGRIKNSTNLSVKAIIAISAMSQMAHSIGNADDGKHYSGIAENYIKQWIQHGEDSMKNHFKAGYNDADGTWFLLYNLYADKLLQTHIVPEKVYQEQDAWYLKNGKKYGVQLTSTKTFTKNDWEMFYAAASESHQVKQHLFDTTAAFLRETKSTAPFSDWVDVNTGASPGFRNRPVIGGVFAPLSLRNHK